MTEISVKTLGSVIDELVKRLTDIEHAYRKVSEYNARNRDTVDRVHEILFDAMVTNGKAVDTVAKLHELFFQSGFRWAENNADALR